MLVALIAAGFGTAFRTAFVLALQVWSGHRDAVSAMHAVPWWARLLLPAVGALLGGLVTAFAARTLTSQGVGDVMESVVVGRTKLSMRVTLSKSLASWLAISAGGSLGREGPLIQFGGSTGQWVAERFGMSPRAARVLVAAGVAAGFGAAYNTPFAAVLFVTEVVTGLAVLEVLGPALVAAAVSTAISRVVMGQGSLFGARTFATRTNFELLAYAALGLVAAIAAIGFMQLLRLGERFFHRIKLTMPWRPALGALLAGAIIAALPEVAGNGNEPLNQVLDGRLALGMVLILALAKCVATTASVSSGSPGGVFTPTLLLGGCVGFAFGTLLQLGFGDAVGPPGGYALVGMAATLAATTHAPLLAAVMAFELSGDYAVVLPLTIATALAASLARLLRRDSLYTAELKNAGVEWELTLDGRRIIK